MKLLHCNNCQKTWAPDVPGEMPDRCSGCRLSARKWVVWTDRQKPEAGSTNGTERLPPGRLSGRLKFQADFDLSEAVLDKWDAESRREALRAYRALVESRLADRQTIETLNKKAQARRPAAQRDAPRAPTENPGRG